MKVDWKKTVKNLKVGQIIYWEKYLDNHLNSDSQVWGFGYKTTEDQYFGEFYYPKFDKFDSGIFTMADIEAESFKDEAIYFEILDPEIPKQGCICDWLSVLALGCKCGNIIPYEQRRFE